MSDNEKIAKERTRQEAAKDRNKSEGGPAFPQTYLNPVEQMRGMTMRDYFAGQALAVVFDAGKNDGANARQAYNMADALLAERSK